MEESTSSKEMNSVSDPFDWDFLGSDLTELIFSRLSITSIVRAASVCKLWHSFITAASFSTRFSTTKKPWVFLYGQNNVYLKHNQAFAFDPESNEWIKLSTDLLRCAEESEEPSSFTGSGGFFLNTITSSESRFSFSPILTGNWRETPPLEFDRCNPLVCVFYDGSVSSYPPRFIVAGGVRFGFIGGLVDIEEYRLAVEIYNPYINSWERCPPLPADFRSGNSSQTLSSALFKRKFYVFAKYTGFISSFDLNKHVWSQVQTLRPPGVTFSFLLSCQDELVLAGLCNSPSGPSFILWRIDEKTMEFSEVAIMPDELLRCLFDFDSEGDDKFASLKCVGLDNLIFVFNEEHHRNYPACICEIQNESGKCTWRRVPSLPQPVNQFHKVISFCSPVSLDNLFHRKLRNMILTN